MNAVTVAAANRQTGSAPRAAAAEPHAAQQCAHWPLDGTVQIQLSARLLREQAERWDSAALAARASAGRVGCIDLEAPASGEAGPGLEERLAGFPLQLQARKQALRTLADDYATVSAWLGDTARTSWEAARATRQRLGASVATPDSHRVTGKDWLAADMNAMVSGVLRRTVAVLDRLDLQPHAIRQDLAGPCGYGPLLRLAAAMLDDAASLAGEALDFVENYDRRWQQLQYRVADAMAMANLMEQDAAR